MKTKSCGIFKSEAGEQLMKDWYQKFLKKLSYPVESVEVKTSIGPTSVLISGPKDGIPVVGLHGAVAGAPHMMGELGDIPNKYRFYGIDIVGQSVASAQVRPDVKTDAFACWLSEVLDELKLDKVILMAVSWGGCVAMNTAVYCPERIQGMILLSPGSIVSGKITDGIFKMSIPMMVYKMFPRKNLQNWALRYLMTEPSEYWTPFIADSLLHVKSDFSLPPLVTKKQLEKLQAPVYVFGSDQDIVFPGDKLVKRSKEIFLSLLGSHIFSSCRHCPPFHQNFMKDWIHRVKDVLAKMGAEASS